MEAKLKEARAELRSEFAIDRDEAMGELHKEYLASRLHSEAFNKCVARCVELKTGPLKAQIARLQDQAKPQPKPKPQPGIATLHKQIATLKEENRALAAKVTKIASLKRARTMQHDARQRATPRLALIAARTGLVVTVIVVSTTGFCDAAASCSLSTGAMRSAVRVLS